MCYNIYRPHKCTRVHVHVGGCPTNDIGKMAIYLSLDLGTNVGGWYINWFMFPSILMDVD
jgi:hypothetical protein